MQKEVDKRNTQKKFRIRELTPTTDLSTVMFNVIMSRDGCRVVIVAKERKSKEKKEGGREAVEKCMFIL